MHACIVHEHTHVYTYVHERKCSFGSKPSFYFKLWQMTLTEECDNFVRRGEHDTFQNNSPDQWPASSSYSCQHCGRQFCGVLLWFLHRRSNLHDGCTLLEMMMQSSLLLDSSRFSRPANPLPSDVRPLLVAVPVFSADLCGFRPCPSMESRSPPPYQTHCGASGDSSSALV